MALDKVVDSAALDAGMTAVADAIRAKAGTTEPMAWPDGFKAAIEAISGGGGTGLAYDMGEFVLDADTAVTKSTYVAHNLGEKPGFILVWTDDYVGVTNPDETYATALGFVWFNQIMGLENWFTTSMKGEGTTVNFTQTKGSTGMNVVKPTSGSYTIASRDVSAESFKLVKIANNIYYRAGTTYKYFVSKAWWNIGGVANAE